MADSPPPLGNITRREALMVFGAGAGTLVVCLAIAAGLYAALRPGPKPAEEAAEEGAGLPTLVVQPVAEVGAPDPAAPYWASAPTLSVPVLAQQVAMPALDAGTVSALDVQAVSDGTRVAFRVSWVDGEPDWNVDAGRFCDAVAIGFPLDEGASPMMGHEGARVQIVYWKALWQKDIDEHFQDVQDLHPNYWSDLYWFAEGEHPYPIPGAFEDPRSRQWFVAQEAGNPMSTFDRREPVEELVAEGWGTLTHQPESVSRGRGVYQDGRWAVVFTRPLASDDPLDYRVGDAGQLILAVWDGGAGNAGGRKHWSSWVPFRAQESGEVSQ